VPVADRNYTVEVLSLLARADEVIESRCSAGVRWLREQARARKLREEQTRRYLWWTLRAAVLSVIVEIIGLAVAWFGR
jgi:membrane protein YqaA with SNARE-associated domain